ncbi:lipopolysaccharide biosynthesis protein [Sphingomonas ginkgonis]|uniref:lipopolysaccharide biosynthesis protein n=1 Tax=Sphingomonas ginkgonis TaxID=2315330 RepID=UPI00163B4413|nr:lipopolysaccharide biosynthesis protein [Sphingomonas ginkgonis]
MSDGGTPAAPVNYRRAALGGAAVTGLGTLTKASLQVAAIIVLARLLTPADFGIMAMVFPIIAFAQVLQDAGLGSAVLQRSEISEPELATMFWLNAAVGIVLALLFLAVSPFVADFYHEPRVQALTAASGTLLLLAALAVQPRTILNRNLRFTTLAISDALSLLVGTLLACGVAWLTGSYWSIFLLSFGASATECVFAWALAGWRPTVRAPLHKVMDLVRFGGHMTLSNIAGYFSRNLDNILIGRVWGATALGFYERAYKVVLMPVLFVHMPLFRLMVPILSRTRDEPERYRRQYLLSYQLSLLLTVPGLTLLASATTIVVGLVMGPKWITGAPIFAWLALTGLFQLVTGPIAMMFVSQNRPRAALVSSVVSSIYTVVAFLIGIRWGAVGVAMAYAISEGIRTPLMVWYATSEGPIRFKDATATTLPFVLAAIVCFVLTRGLLLTQLDETSPLLFTVTTGILLYLVTIPILMINHAGREFLREIFTAVGNMLRRFRKPGLSTPPSA